MRRVASHAWIALLPVLAASASCGSNSEDLFSDGDAGAHSATGGTGSAGAATGGRTTGGSGSATGGSKNASGGQGVGGAMNGTGGSKGSGGSGTGGGDTGGVASGGSATTGGSLNSGGTASVAGSAALCTDSDANDPPRTRGTTTGLNGSFTDECNEDGDLVEYSCEMLAVPPDQCPLAAGAAARVVPIPLCPPMPTGQVLPSVFPCGGRCLEGTCLYWCPRFEDEIEYVGIEGTEVLLENVTNGYRYDCVVSFEAAGQDCDDPSHVGSRVPVIALGNCNATTVVFGTDDPDIEGGQECTYTCSLAE